MPLARRPRVAVALLALAVVVGGGALAATPTAADDGGSPLATQADPDDARLTVTDVTVSPTTPTVEDSVTLDVTLRNSAGSPSAVAVDRVVVRTDSGETVATATDPGTLSPGDTLTVPVTARFEAAGERSLSVVAVGTDDEGDRVRVTRPLSVVVERAPPRLDVEVNRTVAGTETTVTVAVANPTDDELRDVVLSVGGEGVVQVGDGRSVPDLAAGQRLTVELSARPERVGEGSVAVTAAYATASGLRSTTTARLPVEVAAPERDLGVRVTPATEEDDGGQLGGAVGGVLGGGRSTEQSDDEDRRPRRVDVTVTNFGNVPAEAVVVTPRVGDRTLPRRALPRLAPGASATVTVDLSAVDRPGTVAFAVDYRAAGETGDAVARYDYRPPTGGVTLTGVDLAFENGHLRITGNAGNTGDAPVQGVVVAVGDGPGVAPAYPRRTYFVGTVDGSEFAPFEVTADVDPETVSSIPVRVRYTVDGVTVNRTVEVPYDDSLEPESGGGPPLLLYAGGVVALVAVAVGVAVYARRSRSGSG